MEYPNCQEQAESLIQVRSMSTLAIMRSSRTGSVYAAELQSYRVEGCTGIVR